MSPWQNWEDILTDLIQALHRFKDDVRWKDFHRQNEEEKIRRLKFKGGGVIKKKTTEHSEEGMKTGLKATRVNLSAPRACDEVESFLTKLVGLQQ
jgi:hypothetical protein